MAKNNFDQLTDEQKEAVVWGATLRLSKALAEKPDIDPDAYILDMRKKIAADDDDNVVSYLFKKYHDPEARFKMERDNVSGIDLIGILRANPPKESGKG